MKLLRKLRKFFRLYNLKSEGIKWVRQNLGEQYVCEFVEKYDSLQAGEPIGDFWETAVFLNMIEQIKHDI